MSDLPYQCLPYCHDTLEGFLKEDNYIPTRIRNDLEQIKELYWELFILSKSIDKYMDGEYPNESMVGALNKFRANTGLVNRGG